MPRKEFHLEWQNLAGEGFHCLQVPGTHLGMLAGPVFQELSSIIEQCIDLRKADITSRTVTSAENSASSGDERRWIAKLRDDVNDKVMYEPPPDYKTVFETKQRAACLESRLVLDAVGIAAEVVHREHGWLLVVHRNDWANATAELDAYQRENADRSVPGIAVPIYGGAAAAVLVYAGILLLIGIFSSQGTYGLDWFAAGRMQAGQVMAGQWWRTVTALTLHVDVGHLISNLVFGLVFGFLAGRVLGGGVGWLAIVIAGALGNLINAMVQAPTHSSIGASTAVFAALGVIVAHALRPRVRTLENRWKRWSPLIGGVVLLAFTGVGGQRTDVVAHVTGFLAGLGSGWVGCRLPDHRLASRDIQKWAGWAAITIVALAWIMGLAMAG